MWQIEEGNEEVSTALVKAEPISAWGSAASARDFLEHIEVVVGHRVGVSPIALLPVQSAEKDEA